MFEVMHSSEHVMYSSEGYDATCPTVLDLLGIFAMVEIPVLDACHTLGNLICVPRFVRRYSQALSSFTLQLCALAFCKT